MRLVINFRTIKSFIEGEMASDGYSTQALRAKASTLFVRADPLCGGWDSYIKSLGDFHQEIQEIHALKHRSAHSGQAAACRGDDSPLPAHAARRAYRAPPPQYLAVPTLSVESFPQCLSAINTTRVKVKGGDPGFTTEQVSAVGSERGVDALSFHARLTITMSLRTRAGQRRPKHDVDSSDDASEDDVDNDLIPNGDSSDADPDEGPGRRASAPAKKSKSYHAPLPPPLPAPIQTIRLEIKLGGPDSYEIDVKSHAREEGFVWGELVSKKYGDSSDGEDGSEGDNERNKDIAKDKNGDVEMDAGGKPKPKKAKAKKKSKAAAEYYDVPEKTQIKEEGGARVVSESSHCVDVGGQARFHYAEEGEIRLRRCRNVQVAPASKATKAANAKALGTKDSPIALEDVDEDNKMDVLGGSAGVGGARWVSGKGKEKMDDMEGDDGEVNRMKGKWKERVAANGANESVNGEADASAGGYEGEGDGEDEASLHPDLQVSTEKMNYRCGIMGTEIQVAEPQIAACRAVSTGRHAGRVRRQFFNLMLNIFPYNKFTMSKLIRRCSITGRILEQLSGVGSPKAQEEWQRSLRKEKAAAQANGGTEAEGSAGPTRHGRTPRLRRVWGPRGCRLRGGKGDNKDAKDKGAGDKDDEREGGPGKGGAHHVPPLKKHRMTEAMKAYVWQLVLLSNEIYRLWNEGSVLQVSEQGLRKVLYQRIVSTFPDGWISRDVSAMKKKYEKEATD
ncbi:hypothetical protein GGX14DRAFT_645881 [Mycena pura]|uniref:Ubinuclein middle domain-containing protein n=1 Tax=Mycena pura TaxID=153505 RepID=A0AAD6Y6U6_9AGAR|nr:hypothetical protein GGX14DRAFT_645881 [Mycena pura]